MKIPAAAADLLLEDTFCCYAQDDTGNIYYFGEGTTDFLYDDDGNPIGSSKKGPWQAGIDGAAAGLIMLTDPSAGTGVLRGRRRRHG